MHSQIDTTAPAPNRRGTISAKVELDVATASGVKRQEVSVSDGDDLEQSAKRAIYADFRVGEINTAKGEEFLELCYPGGEAYLALGHHRARLCRCAGEERGHQAVCQAPRLVQGAHTLGQLQP